MIIFQCVSISVSRALWYKHDDDVVAYVMHVAAFERGAVVCIKL